MFSDDPKCAGSKLYSTYREATVARRLYIYGDQHEIVFDGAVRYHTSSAELRYLVSTSFEQEINPKTIIEKNERTPTPDRTEYETA